MTRPNTIQNNRLFAYLLAVIIRTLFASLFIAATAFSDLSLAQSAGSKTNWRNVQSQDDFLDEYVVKHPIVKKLIADRYLNYFHDRIDKLIGDEIDTAFNPTDWIQAIDHAANGEFKKLKLFAGEAIGKKLIETIFPFGGTILTQSYDFAKMVSDEVEAWGNQKDVKTCVGDFLSQFGDAIRTTTDYRQLSNAYLNGLFILSWGETRERYGWTQWTKSRKDYWETNLKVERRLKVQCWEAVMNVALKHRKNLRRWESIRTTARAEQLKFAKLASKVYIQLTKTAKVLYYAGVIDAPDVDKYASKIQQFLKLERARQVKYIEKAKEGYARAMGEDAIKKVEELASELERHHYAYEDGDDINRLLSMRNPDYRQFYSNYQLITNKFISGRMRFKVYNEFKYRNKGALESVHSTVWWTVKKARGLVKKAGISGETEKKVAKKAGKLLSEISEHSRKIEDLKKKLEKKIAAFGKERLVGYKTIIKSKPRGTSPQVKQLERASNKTVSAGAVSVSSIKLSSGQTVDRLPPPTGDVVQYTHDVEIAYAELDKNLDADLGRKIASIKKNAPKLPADVQDLIRQTEHLEEWTHANQHWVDFLKVHDGVPFEDPINWRVRAIDAGYKFEKEKLEPIIEAEIADDHLWDVQNQQARAAFTFNEVRTRVAAAEAISAEASSLLNKYSRLDLNLAASVPGILTKQNAEGIVDLLRNQPKRIKLADLDFALSHFDKVRRDLGRENYKKVLNPVYVKENNSGVVFFHKIPKHGNAYLRWGLKQDYRQWLRKMHPRFRQVLQAVNRMPIADRDAIEVAHAEALALQKHANAASLQKWENAAIADAVNATAPIEKLKEQIAWVRLANQRLNDAINAHKRAQAYMSKYEPEDRKRVLALFDKAEKLRSSNLAAALVLVEQAISHLEFVLTFMPYAVVGHGDMYKHGKGLAAALKIQINKTGDDIYDFPEGGNYHVTINGVSTRTMRRYEANKIASADGSIEIRTESYDPVFRNAEKIMIHLYSGQRLRRPVFTTVARNKPGFVHKLKVPYGKPHTLEVRIVSDKLVGYSPVQYPLSFHWGKMPTVSIGNVKTIRVRDKGDVVTLTGKLNDVLELKFTKGSVNAQAELHVLGLTKISLYGQRPWNEYGMLRGQWTELTPFTTDPASSQKFRHYSTEEEDSKGIRLWEFQAYIEPGEQYNVYQNIGGQWQLKAYIIGMDVNKPKPPKTGGGQTDNRPDTIGYNEALVVACATADGFVKSLYHSAFEREPTISEVQVHVERLQSGTLRQQLIRDFLLSAEYEGLPKGGGAFIKDAYQVIYARQATLSELKSWPRTRRSNIIDMMLKDREHIDLTSGCASFWRQSKSGEIPPKIDTDDGKISTLEAWEKYTAAYKLLTKLMAEGKVNTPEAQAAYKKFKHFKDLYEKAKANSGGQPKTSGNGKTIKTNTQARYIGCYIDKPDRDIQGHNYSSGKMTNQACINSCGVKGFAIAATQFSSHCFCGNSYGRYGKAAVENQCKYPCKGNDQEMCGGYWRNSVFKIGSTTKTTTPGNSGSGTGSGSETPPANGISTGEPSTKTRLEPIGDSHVYAYSYRNWNKSNLGKYNVLGAGWHPSGGEKRAYLKFDLAGIDPNSFSKATLKLHHYHTGGSNSVALGIHRVTEPWSEGSDTYHSGQSEKNARAGEITWINQPAFDPTPVLGFNPGSNVSKSIELDITPLVKRWLEGAPNYGLVIKSQGRLEGKPAAQYGFHAREHNDIDTRPVLLLTTGTLGGDIIDPPANDGTASNSSAFGSGNYQSDGFRGDIYYLAKGTSRLPDFATMKPVGSIYSRSINIPNQSFTKGFPGVTDRFEWFGIRYTASLRIDRPGAYSFRTYSDDGSKLWVDSKLVINNDGTHPARSASGNIQLDPGVHTIQLDYFQGPRTMVALKLFITPPSGVETIFDGVFQPSAPVVDNSPIGDVSGKWVINQSNGFVGVLDLQQNANGRLSGTARWSGAEDGPISGRLVGDRIEFTIHYSWGQGFYKGTSVSGGARLANGTTTASNGDTANWTATRQVNTPPPRDTDDPPVDADNEANKTDKITAYQRYIAAYNKLTDLMARGDGETPAAQRAYREYKKAKDAYEAILN